MMAVRLAASRGNERHVADWTPARLISPNVRMHRARPLAGGRTSVRRSFRVLQDGYRPCRHGFRVSGMRAGMTALAFTVIAVHELTLVAVRPMLESAA